jgi:hypothetical protein
MSLLKIIYCFCKSDIGKFSLTYHHDQKNQNAAWQYQYYLIRIQEINILTYLYYYEISGIKLQ